MTSLRTTLLLLCTCLLHLSGFTQNVTITPDGITPDLSGSYQRLSYDAIVALTSPQDGDIAYDVTFKCMRLYNGTKWVRLISDDDLNIPSTTAWSGGSPQEEAGHAIATDSSGNIFVTGYFSGSATFNDTTVNSSGGKDIFVAKYNSTGTLRWVQTAGGTESDVANCIAVDKNGDVIIAGFFYISCTFDSNTFTSAGKADMFVAKYSNTGELHWVKQGGSSEIDAANGMVLDNENNIYITGYYGNDASFDSTAIPHAGLADLYIVKYNANGALQWLEWLGSTGNEVGKGITIDPSGAIYITGYFNGTSTSFDSITLTNSGSYDILVAKYDPKTNSWKWAKKAGGSVEDRGNSIVLAPNRNIYVTGFFGGNANFDGTTLVSAGKSDAFIAKYDSTGSLVWARQSGGINDDIGNNIGIDADENIYFTGYFNDTASFENTSITSAGDVDIYIAKYNSSGVVQWVQKYGGVYGDEGLGITVDNANNIYMTGVFQLSSKFGSKNLTSAGGQDIFLARIKE